MSVSSFARFILRAALLACALTTAVSLRADYTVTPNQADNRGVWDGWGTSLCWWGRVIGDTPYKTLNAQLLFSYDSVDYLSNGTTLPGLGLNIARYNIGGGGQSGDYSAVTENKPSTRPWQKDINGFWKNPLSRDPASSSWDWTRDPEQRAMMTAARDMRSGKGLSSLVVEFFSNAPMWWMTPDRSSAGGTLLSSRESDFAYYVARVAQHAKANWGITPRSITPLNEPSASWWAYPASQEGCIIGATQQCRVLDDLDSELTAAGVSGTILAAPEESYQSTATSTYNTYKSTTINGRTISSLVDRVNTHSYSSTLSSDRQNLRNAVGSKTVWVSEFGTKDATGRVLADQIVGDLYYLKPAAWVYWQAVEPASWGLVTANFPSTSSGADRGKPTGVNQKYYVFAQFTRALRNGYTVYGTSDQYTVCGYEPGSKTLVFVTVNHGTAQNIRFDLASFSSVAATSASVRFSETTAGGRAYASSTVSIANRSLTIQAGPYTVYSVTISGVTL